MIRNPRPHLAVNTATHPGMKGKNNEDRFAVASFWVDESRSVPALVAIVSDGIGGHRAGEVAAEIAVETITKIIGGSDASQPQAILQDAIAVASEEIRAQAERDLSQRGMGATCVCAWIITNQLYAATVGDSRLYLIRQKGIRRLSTDHTWIQEALEHGAITPQEARTHPNAHVIRRYLGSPQPAEPDLRLRLHPYESDEQSEANQGLPLFPGDILVLCSDGLTDLVEDPEILATVLEAGPETAPSDLVSLANERGGHDNITIIVLQVTSEAGLGDAAAELLEDTAPLATLPLEATQPLHPPAATQPVAVARPAAAPPKSRPAARRPRFSAYLPLTVLLVFAVAVLGLVWASGIVSFGAELTPTPTSTPTLIIPIGTLPPNLPATQSAPLVPGGLPTPSRQIPSGSVTPTLTPWPTNTPRPLNIP